MAWWKNVLREKELNSRYVAVIFCFSCVMLVVFTSVIYQQSRNVERSNAHVAQSHETLRKAHVLLASALSMETGQRGYLLTGSRFFLEPYTQAINSLDAQIANLRSEVRNDPNKIEYINRLDKAITSEKELLSKQVAVFRQKGAWAINIETLKESKRGMDEIRALIEGFIEAELKGLAVWRNQAKSQIDGYFITLFVGAALSIGGLLLANLIILRLMARNRDAELERQYFEESYQLLLRGIHDGIFDFYPDINRVVFSSAYQPLLGYSTVELQQLDDPFRALVHPEDYSSFIEELRRFIRRETEEFQMMHRMQRKDGNWVWMLARAVSVSDAKGAVRRIVGIHTDLTAQKAYEEQLKQMNGELEGFTYIASHDLRAPLVNLKGFSTEMKAALTQVAPVLEKAKPMVEEQDRQVIEQTFERDIPEALGFIQAAVEKMDKLTTAILDLSRIGRRQYRSERVDTNVVIKRCVDALAYELIERETTVEIDTLPIVQTDALAFEQIISNLLDNAVKYLSKDRKGHISVKAKRTGGVVIFSVSDNGRGIAEADYSRVFDIFRRASNSGDVRGIGMGMAYVQATVRKLGGRIWFHSMLGEGTSFYFTLPDNGEI